MASDDVIRVLRPNHLNARFDADEPLALLAIDAALRGTPKAVPAYSAGRGYFHGQFEGLGRTYDSNAIWSRTRDERSTARE